MRQESRQLILLALTAVNVALIILLALVGISRNEESAEPKVVISNQYQRLDEWQVMMMAIMEEESGYDSQALSDHNARGVMQITPIYVDEINRISRYRYEHMDAHNDTSAVVMFTTMQDYYNAEHDIDKAIRMHNPTAGKWYARRIKMRMDVIRRMEELRELIINY